MEERSGSFLPELPYTNRGVIRQKEELSALIDWCQITVKEVPLEAVIEDVLRIPLELMTVTGYEKGIAGHEVVAIFDNIKVLKPTGNAQYQGFQILMSGKGCRNYENFLQLNEDICPCLFHQNNSSMYGRHTPPLSLTEEIFILYCFKIIFCIGTAAKCLSVFQLSLHISATFTTVDSE